jgi:hypothetical protein
MKEIKGNLFDHIGVADAICITTNGTLRHDGRAVMGRGCALAAVQRWPHISTILGDHIALSGNGVYSLIVDKSTMVLSFPVKNNWWEKADIDLIKRSARDLMAIADAENWEKVILPRPGCGNGKLSWNQVRETIKDLLDDRFYIITF